ncbi:MAG: hypothetical protein ACQEV0_16045 [Bacillota bacterium]
MRDQHKNEIIKKLGDILPPFSEAIINLTEDLKSERKYTSEVSSKLIELVRFSGQFANAIQEQISTIKSQLDRVTEENDKLKDLVNEEPSKTDYAEREKKVEEEIEFIQNKVKELRSVQILFIQASEYIQKGMYALLYLDAEEQNKLNEFLALSEELDPVPPEEISIDFAVNNLYEGAKLLVSIIDIIFKE